MCVSYMTDGIEIYRTGLRGYYIRLYRTHVSNYNAPLLKYHQSSITA